MMIDFALQAERNEGKGPADAIFEACMLRFRPILMTTMAALFGALPLALGTGTGSETPEAARDQHRGRPHRQPTPNALYHPGIISGVRPAPAADARQAARYIPSRRGAGPPATHETDEDFFAKHDLPRHGALRLGDRLRGLGRATIRPRATIEPLPTGYKETPAQYKGTAGWKVADPKDGILRGEWWKIFHDPQLNELEAQLNLNNQNIKQSFENFLVARAMIGEQVSQYYPTVTGSLSVTRARSAGSGRGSTVEGVGNTGTGTSTGTTGTTGTGTGTGTTGTSGGTGVVGAVSSAAGAATSILTSVDVAWEPDLWGGVSATPLRSAEYNTQLKRRRPSQRATERTVHPGHVPV